MRTPWLAIVLAATLALPATVVAAENLTAREIMERVEDRDEGNPSIVDVEMTLIDKSGKKRLDWILISEELEFVSYQVLPDIVSDHLPLIVEIRQR